MAKQILIVEDDPIMRLGMEHFLRSRGYEIMTCSDGNEAIEILEKMSFDIIISDLKMPYYDGFEILKRSKNIQPHAYFIIITAYADIKDAVEAIRQGAFDYIAKPFSNEELLIAIEKCLHFQKLENEIYQLKETLKEKVVFENIIGVSPQMQKVFKQISSVAVTDAPVLIQGQSGTGKELVANAIHNLSKRADKIMVKINCAAIPENLFESELFGYERGAFTGATKTKIGKIEYANEGTIFFDEIGDLPLSLQPKFLRLLEDNTITRLGDNREIKVDIRMIFATSKNLKDLVAKGLFREDLFYRINIVPITLPPLRERTEDIPYLVEYFLRQFCKKFNKPNLKISSHAFDVLMSYNYPGNVRELKHAIERAVILAQSDTITTQDLPQEMRLTGSIDQSCMSEHIPLEQSIKCFEKQKIIMALRETAGKKIEAAKLLGISRKVLWSKIKEYGIDEFFNLSQQVEEE
ncbi:MAG: sigma-54 dependent transcriptional regulator [Thermodesulfovibrionales bacterium]|nr:sigma-54 dependent transcriptional regulator [Thermodesulfovibrionales bacterium]